MLEGKEDNTLQQYKKKKGKILTRTGQRESRGIPILFL
jgi:hypothetical protein